MDEQSPETMFQMEMKFIEHFKNFFEPDGLPHFAIALRNLEIARLSSEIAKRDNIITELNGSKNATTPEASPDPVSEG